MLAYHHTTYSAHQNNTHLHRMYCSTWYNRNGSLELAYNTCCPKQSNTVDRYVPCTIWAVGVHKNTRKKSTGVSFTNGDSLVPKTETQVLWANNSVVLLPSQAWHESVSHTTDVIRQQNVPPQLASQNTGHDVTRTCMANTQLDTMTSL